MITNSRYTPEEIRRFEARDKQNEALSQEANNEVVVDKVPQALSKFFETEKSMRKLGALFLVLGLVLAVTTVVVSYTFHASQFSIDNPIPFKVILCGAGILSLGTFTLGLYWICKPYWKDPLYVQKRLGKYEPENQVALVKLLKINDLPHISEVAMDRNPLMADLTNWLSRMIGCNSGNNFDLITPFIEVFGWRPFELGILVPNDTLADGSAVAAAFQNCFINLDESKKNEFRGQLLKWGFNVS